MDSNAAAEPTCKQPATAYQAFKAIFHGGRSRPDSSKIRDLAIIVLNIDLKKRISLLLRALLRDCTSLLLVDCPLMCCHR